MIIQYILGAILILSSMGVLLFKKPVHASLSFLLTLLTLAIFFLQLSAEFIGVMQVLVYAGAILVIFVFVIVLFQDAHGKIDTFKPQSLPFLLYAAASIFLLGFAFFGKQLYGLVRTKQPLPKDFGTVESIGKLLYVDFFFPFEVVILLFLIAIVGAFYIGKKVR